jgi:uncharacterized coiled-coil protein SlyX
MTTYTALAERARRFWRAVGSEGRIRALEARVDHLESALEGLQDAVHRRSVLEDKEIERLRNRTEPAQLARDLSREARQRGL